MSGTTALVDCVKDGTVIRTYDFLSPDSSAAPGTPDHDHLISECKNNLMVERLAKPPFEGIKFIVRLERR